MRRVVGRKGALLAMLLALFFCAILLEVADGRPNKPRAKGRRKKSRAGVGKDFSEFLLVIATIMVCVIAPVAVVFLCSLYKDPAVPDLARAGWKAFKGRMLSYLGQDTVSSSTPRGRNSSTPASAAVRQGARRRDVTTISNNNTGDAPWMPGEDRTAPWRSIPPVAEDDSHPARWKRTTDDYRGTDSVHKRHEPPFYDVYANCGDRHRRAEYEHQQQQQQQHGTKNAESAIAPYSSGLLQRRVGRAFDTKAERRNAPPPGFMGGSSECTRQDGGSLWEDFVREEERELDPRAVGWGYEDKRPRMEEATNGDEEGAAGSTNHGVYKGAQSKGRMARSRRARGVKASTRNAGVRTQRRTQDGGAV